MQVDLANKMTEHMKSQSLKQTKKSHQNTPNPSKTKLFLKALPVVLPTTIFQNLSFLCYCTSRRKTCNRTFSLQDTTSMVKMHYKWEEKELLVKFHHSFLGNRRAKQLIQHRSGLFKEVRGSISRRNVFWFRKPLK